MRVCPICFANYPNSLVPCWPAHVFEFTLIICIYLHQSSTYIKCVWAVKDSWNCISRGTGAVLVIPKFKDTLALMFHEEGVSVITKNSIMAALSSLLQTSCEPTWWVLQGLSRRWLFFLSQSRFTSSGELWGVSSPSVRDSDSSWRSHEAPGTCAPTSVTLQMCWGHQNATFSVNPCPSGSEEVALNRSDGGVSRDWSGDRQVIANGDASV